MTIEELKNKDMIIFECQSGSHAYGLATEDSDLDIKGVFILPEDEYFGLRYVEQVSNDSNDIVYYELKRFVDLLTKSNPTALELLHTPDESVLYMHPVFEAIRGKQFLSKKCLDTFGGYAMTQVKKAKGLKKKILNPVDKERKSILDFCYVADHQGSVPVKEYLKSHKLIQEECGLSKLPNMNEMYALYYGDDAFHGIQGSDNANDVTLSSIPKGLQPMAFMSFNKSAYSSYCKEYKEYWEWVDKRNDNRYKNTLQNGKNYDAKNMMHTFRLLKMCEEIGREGKLHVKRQDREYLLSIKRGEFEYNDLLLQTEMAIDQLKLIYQESSLANEPDFEELNRLLILMRREYYG
ncbi:nucleotidyltransferase domain-containing protein [Fulvivirga ligni]|uniref:nucleotidyltransferase domain-containing protein n=1 Tax=Fulvivirga ligni TaxID=2904246 RepID=UPI001F44D612|nr:nucleotidyltransferase domain-containing protein [Fulvivirga ligni]UII19272.1 nucleotidyltransferase domain-containing protein [Fulvivirga ligni]